MTRFTSLLSFALLILLTDQANSQLRVAQIFSDNMVLQREQPIIVWGWANPDQTVTVEIAANDQAKTTTDDQGRWQVQLKPMAAQSTPFEVRVQAAADEIVFKNVVAGDVWICSGQSNMEWPVKACGNPVEEIANGNHPLIRHIKIGNQTSLVPQDTAMNSGWQVCTPENVQDFTATGYYFGRELNRELNVPIGLLNTSWGGTIIEAWISGGSLKTHPDFKNAIETIEAMNRNDNELQSVAAKAAKWQFDFQTALADRSDDWAPTSLDDGNWEEHELPANWELLGHPDLDGVAWYRREFAVPQAWAGREIILSLAKIDDADETYINGTKIGGMDSWNEARKYTIAKELVTAGPMTIAIRVTDGNGGGGIHGEPESMTAAVVGQPPISLAGKWKFRVGSKTAALGPRPQNPVSGPNNPMVLYNAMVHPLHPFQFKGAIWYQGESNAERAYQYRTLMPLLISDWRSKWSTPDSKNEFPFYWVQLANFTAPTTEPGPSDWAELREAQSMTLSVPNTGQAVIIDIGDAVDIHPKNKQEVGRRLALLALARQSNGKIESSGPTYQGMKSEGNRIRLTFNHAAGLVSLDGGPLKRFEIAGADRKFVWAEAQINGEEVVVWSDSVSAPAAVRYAWANNPAGCNLYNAAGLPASPFRTDSWPGMTADNR